MRRWLLAGAAFLTGLFAVPEPAAAATPVRILPLGASITWGTASTDGNGYREQLRRHLADDAGIAVDFVGSQQSGTGTDRDNEGHPGYRIDQVAAGADAWIAAAKPDVVLLNAGTNDMIQNHDVVDAPARLSALIDQILRGAPAATVMVSTLVPNRDSAVDARVTAFNAKVPGIVQAKAAAGQRVRLVDLHAGLTLADIGSDGIHPTDDGYSKLADTWYAALQPVLGAGRPWPLFRTDLGAAVQQLTWTDTVAGSLNVGGYCCGLTAMESGRRAELAHGGTYALMYSGNDLSAAGSYSYNRLYHVHLAVTTGTTLTYWIRPQQANGAYVAIDLLLTDGRSLRDSGAVDQFGVRAHPRYQGQGGHVLVDQWNRITVDLGPLAGGTVDEIRIGYDQPGGTGLFRGYVDDIDITRPAV
ncbi:SGNH/GDSL hydrolase family protein [Dactylosporangium matsuzakiense]|uniref:Lipase n=1 Tax=Dactylosporangium matsuzakiense TaxID=53360 RepID=A0A9W6NNL3_9ACTN|nr:SGNH/GDSL hydrolase family protein [Dactylosporangium matsuzakiense]UWZ48738.1 GDSL family lipase [Dactylosporangium matsuzakiense]GLL03117.1 lipase [Dactylosporangium matsuzakiense]